MEFIFVAPERGHTFCRDIAAGLADAGHTVRLMPAAAFATVKTNGAALVVDGPALEALPPSALDLPRALAFVHHATPGARAALPRLGRVVVTGSAMAARVTETCGLAPERVRVVQPGLRDLPRARSPEPVGQSPCAILSVGRVARRKGHDVLLRALGRLRDLDWRLTVVGNAPGETDFAEALQAQAAELGIAPRVTLRDTLPDAALEAAWRAADVFALATRWEGYAPAVAEALRRGLPVAVTAGGDAAALVPPDGGAICPVDDADGLSKALRRMVFDPEARRVLGDGAWRAGRRLPDHAAAARAFARAVDELVP